MELIMDHWHHDLVQVQDTSTLQHRHTRANTQSPLSIVYYEMLVFYERGTIMIYSNDKFNICTRLKSKGIYLCYAYYRVYKPYGFHSNHYEYYYVRVLHSSTFLSPCLNH